MDGQASKPDWDGLFETAGAQEGYFTTRQAAEAGYSSQLLLKHLRAGRVVRMRRGIYRLVHFPAGEHEELVIAWLWSKLAGVVSHQTALALHGLSDVPRDDRAWFGAVPATNPRRSLNDRTRATGSPPRPRHPFRSGGCRRGTQTVRRTRRMTVRTYSSPEAFKQALEQRLRTSAKNGTTFARKRQLLAFAGIAPPTLRIYPIETHADIHVPQDSLTSRDVPRATPGVECRARLAG